MAKQFLDDAQVGTAAQKVTAGMPAATQASWKTPAIPVGPSYRDSSRPKNFADSGE